MMQLPLTTDHTYKLLTNTMKELGYTIKSGFMVLVTRERIRRGVEIFDTSIAFISISNGGGMVKNGSKRELVGLEKKRMEKNFPSTLLILINHICF
jgi:hypothetical protein